MAHRGAAGQIGTGMEARQHGGPLAVPGAEPGRSTQSGGRVRVDGKQFAVGGDRFHFRGVTYGTFKPRGDGARFPETSVVRDDLAAIAEAGFTVVRTYTAPTDDMLEIARAEGLRFMAGIFYLDWRYLVGGSRRDVARNAREARAQVRDQVHQYVGSDEVAAICLGNEIPADVIRWVGTDVVSDTLRRIADAVKEEDDGLLVTYANYPTTEYLPLPEMDFLTFNVYLERQADLRRYLNRLHHLAGDRPLVLGEIGVHAEPGPAGEDAQAQALDQQLEVAVERGVGGTCLFSWTDEWWVGDAAVEGWSFGLTRADRSPRPSLEVAARWNRRTVADLPAEWPSVTVVICAYNAEATIDECLAATCALDYPDLEILVVDDGSTDATADIARRHPRAKLLGIPHAGLSVARNEGWAAASGDLVVYLDSDAYPTADWLYYLALGIDGKKVGGVGGPNVAPVDDPLGAHQVARSPGGPVHVLLSDDRAEHVPGCNMAFWRSVLAEVGGFDPIYTSAGDDVDVCWKVLDKGWEIAFHPAALVWHHRRAGARAYLRQQRGYGRAEAMVEANHPDRFTLTGSARWLGKIYASLPPRRSWGDRVYRGRYGAAAFQSVYRGGGHGLDLAHQVGVPVAVLGLLTAPLVVASMALGLFAAASLVFLAWLAAIDYARTGPPRDLRSGRRRFRAGVALLHLMQPVARAWGRRRHRPSSYRAGPPLTGVPGPVTGARRGVLVIPEDIERASIVTAVLQHLRAQGTAVVAATGWQSNDASLLGSTLVAGKVVTSAHPVGFVQLRVRREPRAAATLVLAALSGATVLIDPVAALVPAVVVAVELARGFWNTGPRVRRVITAAGRLPRPVPPALPVVDDRDTVGRSGPFGRTAHPLVSRSDVPEPELSEVS